MNKQVFTPFEAAAQAQAYKTHTVGDKDIPRFVSFTSPVSLARSDDGSIRATTLPLNLIALIVSYLEDIGDIARVTRTSKLLYYMTLPQLYQRVSLHSYPDVRLVNGRPEGYGSGSPVMMALNGLVTKPHAAQVQEFRLWGEWNELGFEDFAKGRVPDNSMMLNIVLRAAVDRMTKLQSFKWELDCKPLKTLYQGLGAHNTLTSLTIRFPNSRQPRPSVVIPPMANLRAFRAIGIDPLCYPDDMSVMLLHSRKLEDLRLHFSPRMRLEAESSLSLDTYFGRCAAAKYKLRLKHYAMHNFYGPKTDATMDIMENRTLRSACFFDTFGGNAGNSRNVFFDETWKEPPPHLETLKPKMIRCNEQASAQVNLLSQTSGLERFYMVNAKSPEDTSSTPSKLATPVMSPATEESTALGQQYLYTLTHHHGSTLKHLLLSEQWVLSEEDISDLVRFCPNLEQLALHASNPCTLRLLLPFLPKLWALRMFQADFPTRQNTDDKTKEEHMRSLSLEIDKIGAPKLRWFGAGCHILQVGARVRNEEGKWIRPIKEVTWEDAKHVEIWGLDCLDIGADPVAPFDP